MNPKNLRNLNLPSLKLTFLAPENVWLEGEFPFGAPRPFFRCVRLLLVLGRVPTTSGLVVATQIFFIFTPKIGEMESNLTCAYFSNGLVKNHQLLPVWWFRNHPPYFDAPSFQLPLFFRSPPKAQSYKCCWESGKTQGELGGRGVTYLGWFFKLRNWNC